MNFLFLNIAKAINETFDQDVVAEASEDGSELMLRIGQKTLWVDEDGLIVGEAGHGPPAGAQDGEPPWAGA